MRSLMHAAPQHRAVLSDRKQLMRAPVAWTHAYQVLEGHQHTGIWRLPSGASAGSAPAAVVGDASGLSTSALTIPYQSPKLRMAGV